MKKLTIIGSLFMIAGAVFVMLPVHVSMTGVVLLLLGCAMVICALLLRRGGERRENLCAVIAIFASGGVILLMAAMNLITTCGQTDWDNAKNAEYAIVLGAGVHENGQPSRIMRTRLAAVEELLEKNPTIQVILSGGQGTDEPVSEAQCMFDALVKQGIDPERLLLEEESETTRENLENSMEILSEQGGTEQPVVLVTSEFHQCRAKFIADSLNLKTCAVSGVTDQWVYRVNYTLREVFAFVKAFVQRGT